MSSIQFEKQLEKYIVGEIDFLSYRRTRRELIQLMTNSGKDQDVTIPKSMDLAQSLEDKTRTYKKKPELEIPQISTEKSQVSSAIKQYLVIALLAIAGGISWYISEKTNVLESTADKSSKSAINPDSSTESFIKTFNKLDTWDSESMSDFLVQWQALSRQQQNTLRQGGGFSQLTGLLRQRIMQQRALSEVNAKAATKQENLLIWFAAQLSISVN